ncbi:MAG: 50S ribosomal protein L21e [Candidatus Thorarchaeota archaeon]
MVKNSHGYRSRTRELMSKRPRDRGVAPPSRILMTYEVGQKVDVIIDPSCHKGMPHRRYHGKTGVVVGSRGRAILVDVSAGKQIRHLIIRPEHLRPSRG